MFVAIKTSVVHRRFPLPYPVCCFLLSFIFVTHCYRLSQMPSLSSAVTQACSMALQLFEMAAFCCLACFMCWRIWADALRTLCVSFQSVASVVYCPLLVSAPHYVDDSVLFKLRAMMVFCLVSIWSELSSFEY